MFTGWSFKLRFREHSRYPSEYSIQIKNVCGSQNNGKEKSDGRYVERENYARKVQSVLLKYRVFIVNAGLPYGLQKSRILNEKIKTVCFEWKTTDN